MRETFADWKTTLQLLKVCPGDLVISGRSIAGVGGEHSPPGLSVNSAFPAATRAGSSTEMAQDQVRAGSS